MVTADCRCPLGGMPNCSQERRQGSLISWPMLQWIFLVGSGNQTGANPPKVAPGSFQSSKPEVPFGFPTGGHSLPFGPVVALVTLRTPTLSFRFLSLAPAPKKWANSGVLPVSPSNPPNKNQAPGTRPARALKLSPANVPPAERGAHLGDVILHGASVSSCQKSNEWRWAVQGVGRILKANQKGDG